MNGRLLIPRAFAHSGASPLRALQRERTGASGAIVHSLVVSAVIALVLAVLAPTAAVAQTPPANANGTPPANAAVPEVTPQATTSTSTSSTTAPSSSTTSTSTTTVESSSTSSSSTSSSSSSTSSSSTTTTVKAPAPSSGPTTLLVKTASGLTADEQQELVTRSGGTKRSSVDALRLMVVSVPNDEALNRYKADKQVERVEVVQQRKVAGGASDPAYGSQWALPKIGWEAVHGTVTPSGSSTIAVLDTGVAGSNPDFAGRLVPGFSAFPGGAATTDPNGHGTWLASIAGAIADNDTGIAGVAYAGVKIMPVQVLGADGTGQDSDIIAGLVAAADARANVILMGFSNPGFSKSLQDAVDYAWSKGAVLVAATGNSSSADPTYPAGDAKVVGVSATDQNDALWTGSNFGTDTFIAAPGVGITADAPSGGTATVTGTSASAALTAGAVALLRANDPGASNGTIVGRLARNADPAGTPAQTGNGRVNLARAMSDAAATEVVPAGAAPVGSGGPFVGPYVAAAIQEFTEGWANKNPAVWDGTLNGSNSSYNEGDSLPVRLRALDQTAGSHTVVVKYDFTNTAGVHFVDSLTSFDRTVTSGASPCDSPPVVSNCGTATTVPIPTDSTLPSGAQPSGNFTVYNATLTAAAYSTSNGVKQLTLNYTVSGNAKKNVVIAFGAHLARQNEWGAGKGASQFPGGSGKIYANFDNANNDTAVSVNPGQVVSAGGTITGKVFNDANGNGTAEAGEAGLTGVNLILSGSATTSATTQADGTYTFSGLNAGTYSVGFTPPSGFVNTGVTPLTGIVLATNTTAVTGRNFFAQQRNASITGTVFSDGDGNGAFTSGETGIAGVMVTVGGNTATTNANGLYSFSGLAAGAYSVDYTVPNGFANTGTKPLPVSVTAGEASSGKSFFAQSLAAQKNVVIGGTLYSDADGDGSVDPGETGIAGVTVTLSPGGATTTTASSGYYEFSGQVAGTYSVDYAVPAGYASTGAKPLSVTVVPNQASTTNDLFARRQTTTAVTSSANPSSYGQSVTLTATVTSGAGIPTTGEGTVTFKEGTTVLCAGVSLATNGTAACELPVLSVGAHTIAADYTGITTGRGFAASGGSFTQTIGKAPLTITATDRTKTYGESVTFAGTEFSASGLTNTDTVTSVTLSSDGAAATAAAGTHAIVASAAVGSGLANYAVTYTSGTLTVTKTTVTITAADKSKVYGDANPLLTGTIAGVKNGDAIGASYSTVATPASPVGGYAIVPAAVDSSASKLGNYDVVLVNGTLTVTKTTLTITAADKSKLYGDANPLLTGTIAGVKNGDAIGASYSTVAAPASPVGSYAIVPAAVDSSPGKLGNYDVVLVNGTLSVTKRSITITANNQTKVYGDLFTFAGTEFTITAGSLAPTDGVTVTLTSAGAPKAATVAGSPYAIVPSAAVFTSGPASNYTVTYLNGALTVAAREGVVAYIGQTAFVTSGSSSTTAQVTLTASVMDPDGAGSVLNATVTFTDLLSNKVLASGVKVSPVSNTDTATGTANTIVTLSTGQYGAQQYLIEVKLGGSYKNDQQTGAIPGTSAYEAAHPIVTVMIPSTVNSMQAAGTLAKLTTAAGKYGDAESASYTIGMKYTNKGTNPQGQIQLVLKRSDGTYYVKSNSITSVAFSNPDPTTKLNKDVTIYTKASIYKVAVDGTLTSIEGNVTLRVDAHEGCTTSPACDSSSGDSIGFTVLSSKDSSLFYSNNWAYDAATRSTRTLLQAVVSPLGKAVVIN